MATARSEETAPPVGPHRRGAVTPARVWTVPGFGTVSVTDVDGHPGLARLAAVGLVLAGLLAAFGLPPVGLHLPTHWLGIMGPLCGMTRSVVRTVTGELPQAWNLNPAGPVLVAGTWAALLRAAWGRLTGRWLSLRFVVDRTGWIAITVLLVALTVNQQLHAELLR